MPLTNATVAAAVRAELARAGVSGRKLARELDWTPGFVQRRLAGRDPFRVDELGRIAEYLRIPATTFLEDGPRAADDSDTRTAAAS